MFKSFRYIYYRRRRYSNAPKPFDTIPGLSSLPFLGPVHHFMPVIGNLVILLVVCALENAKMQRLFARRSKASQ